MPGIVARVTRPALSKTCSPTLWSWHGGLLFTGPALRLDRHSGAVGCLVVGPDGPLTVTVGSAEVVARAVLVPPRLVHHLDAQGGRIVSCYLDPALPTARSCHRSLRGNRHGLGTDHARESELVALGGDLGGQAGPEPPRRWLQLACGAPGADVRPGRIGPALAAIGSDPARNWRAGECARSVGLSESAFLRLFTARTGTTFRRYRLWRRMLLAARTMAAGGNLTLAAAEAGFATPSHLTSAFHTLFGLAPSRLLEAGLALRELPGRLDDRAAAQPAPPTSQPAMPARSRVLAASGANEASPDARARAASAASG